MSGGTELLALTGAAVQPLLFGGREAGGDVDDTSYSSLPTYTIFSPLVDPNSHTIARAPPSLPADTPSPLTIPARELEPESAAVRDGQGVRTPSFATEHVRLSHGFLDSGTRGGGRVRVGGGLRAGESDSFKEEGVLGRGDFEDSLIPWVSPTTAVTPPPHLHSTFQAPIPGAGIKIKISTKKVREVASPLTSSGGAQLQRVRTPMSCESAPSTPGALSPLLPPSPPLSSLPMGDPETRLPSNKAVEERVANKQHQQNKTLAQGVLKNTSNTSPVDTSLESSVIVSQIESTEATHNVKEKLLQRQAIEKQVRFKVVHPQMITQLAADLGENSEKRSKSTTSPQPQKVTGVGGRGDAKHSRVPPESKELQSPYSASSDSSSAGQSINHVTHTSSRLQRKRLPCVSSCRGHVASSRTAATLSAGTTLSNSVSATSAEPQVSFPSNYPLDFEETVKLVASCTAAATAAALTSQKGSRDVARVIEDTPRWEPLTHLSSKERAFDRMKTGNPSATALPHTLSTASSACGIDQSDSVPPSCYVSEQQRGEVGGSAGVFSAGHSQAKTTEAVGVKVPLTEKETNEFATVSAQTHPRRGLIWEQKQPPLLSNQTPHRTVHAKTHIENYFHKQGQGSPPSSCSSGSTEGAQVKQDIIKPRKAVQPVVTGTHSLVHAANHPERCELQSVNAGPSSAKQHALLEVENMLMEVQQARRDLESHSALAEAQQSWKDPLPPVTSDDLNFPEYRVAVFLNQLKATDHNSNEDGMEEVELSRKLKKSEHSDGRTSTVKGQLGGQKGKVTPQGVSQKLTSNSQTTGTKEKHLPRNRSTSTKKTKQVTAKFAKSERLVAPHQKVGKSVRDKRDSRDAGLRPPREMPVAEGQWRVPPPSLPVLHSQVLAPVNSHPRIPMAGYTLPSGMVVCDPSTGMPLLGSALSSAATVSSGAPMTHTVPPPPCIHMPTAMPLGPPSTMPSQIRPLTVHTVPSAEPQPHTHDPTTPSPVSVADVCLQTSLSEKTIPHLVQEVLPAANISTDTESLDELTSGCLNDQKQPPITTTARPFAASVDIEVENNSHLDSFADTMGISLAGKHAGSSPSGPTDDPPFPPGQSCTKKISDTGLSAEEVDRRINEHLESNVLQWVTQELMTRVMAAAEKSHDMSCDGTDLHLAGSPNSCSTCTPPRTTLTSALPLNDISIANVDGDSGVPVYVGDVCVSGAAGEGVRSDVVEVVVREVIQEKVMEAVRETQALRRSKGGETHTEERENTSCTESGSGFTSDSTLATPLIPTPSPSPPPQHSSPPSPTSQDSDSRLSHPLLATPTTTPPFSRRSDSTAVSSPAQTISTPDATAEDVSAITPEEVTHGEREDSATSAPLPHHTLSTPPPSPPHQVPPTSSPPSLTKEEPTPITSVPPLPTPLQPQFSLSESSSSTSPSTTSNEAHPHPHSLTTVTNLTTDQEISMGECMLTRPPLPGATNSLSEGEVALSPGDARWYATYATKMGKWGPQGGSRGDGNNKPKLSPVVAAFLDLKNSPELLCDTSDYSGSFQSGSNTASKGEARPKKKHSGADPFDRFLANLQTSSPEASSTPTPPTSEDNTLSDMPSIVGDNGLSHGEVKEKDRQSTPVRTQTMKDVRNHSPGSVGVSVPYHKKFPLEEGKSASPGEVRNNPPSELAGRALKNREKKSDLSVSFAHSEGEVHPTVQQRRGKRDGKTKQPLPELTSAASPGELRIKFSTSNKTRDGIDVISISNSSPNSYSSFSRNESSAIRSLSQKATPHTLPSLSSLTQPTATSKRRRVRGELGAARVIAVASSSATLGNKEDDVITIGKREPGMSEAAISTETPHLSTVDPSPVDPELSPDVTRPPELDALLQTSSSSDMSPPTPLPELSTAQPPQSGELTEQKSPEKHETSPSPLHSFWDIQSPRIPRFPTSIGTVVQEQKTLAAPPPPTAAETKQHIESSRTSDAQAAQPNSDTTNPVVPTGSDDKETRAGLAFNPKAQLKISVPTATPVEEESSLTSPAPSPTYSSDFDFSSISQD